MKNSILLFLAAGLVAGLSSCKKDQDEEAPTIGEVRINSELAGDHIHIDAGTTINLSIAVRDNEELGQLKIDIHGNSDGHGHEGDDGHDDHGALAQGFWEELQIVELSGTEQTVQASYQVPSTVAGEWHLSLRVLDSSGNESPERIIELDVDNDDLPILNLETVNGVDYEEIVMLAEGDLVSLVGSASDDNGLAHIHIHVEGEDGSELYEMEYEVAGATSFDLSEANFSMPNPAGNDHTELIIEVENTLGLKSMVEVHLHVQ